MPSHLNLKALNFLFGLPDQDLKSIEKISYQNHGPGQLDNWLSVMEDNENSWLQRENVATPFTKKKFIFSNPLLAEKTPTAFDLELMAVIMQHYEVYLWTGDNKSFNDNVPVADTTEFWQKYRTAHPATRKAVESSLSMQGIATDEYVVLDYSKFTRLSEPENFQRYYAAHYLTSHDVVKLYFSVATAESQEKLLKSVNPEEIKTIELYKPNLVEIEFIKNNFPNLEYVYLCYPYQAWLDKFSNLFKDYTVILKNMLDTSLHLHASLKRVQCVTTEQRYAPETVYFYKNGKYVSESVHRLTFMLNFNHISAAAQRFYEEAAALMNATLPVTEGHIAETRYGDLSQYDISAIKSLTINAIGNMHHTHADGTVEEHEWYEGAGSFTQALASGAFVNLESLVIIGSGIPHRTLDLTKLPKLKSFELRRNKTIEYLNFNECKDLERCGLIDVYLKASNTHSSLEICELPKLRNLFVEYFNYQGDSHIVIDNNPQLVTARIIAYSPKNLNLNLTNCDNLRTLELLCVDLSPDSLISLSPDSLMTFRFPQSAVSQILFPFVDRYPSRYFTPCTYTPLIKRMLTYRLSDERYSIDAGIEIEVLRALDAAYNRSLPDSNRRGRNQHDDQSHNAARSRTSNFSSRSSASGIDGDTTSPTGPHIGAGNIRLSIDARQSVPKNNYRLLVSTLTLSGNSINLSPIPPGRYEKIDKNITGFDKNTVAAMASVARENDDYAVAHLQADNLKAREYYALSGHLPLKKNELITVYTNPPNAIDLFWLPSPHMQFYFRMKPSMAKVKNVEILYQYKLNPAYNLYGAVDETTTAQSRTSLFSDSLAEKLAKKIKHLPKLAFLFDEYLTANEKMDLLIIYCSLQFSEGTLSIKPKNDLDTLVAIITEQKGVCRHRSNALMALASIINVPVNIITNEIHAFCEVLTEHGWRHVDLGGGTLLDLTPADKLNNVFANLPKAVGRPQTTPASRASAGNAVADANESQNTAEENKFEEAYYQRISSLVTRNVLQTLDPVMQNNALATLLVLSSALDISRIKKYLIELLTARQDIHKNYLYIHSLEDFKLYLKPFRLDGGRRTQVAGPLADIIRNGGTLIVNWSNFSASAIASYKSVLDKHPTLLGESLSNDVVVIGLSTPSTVANNAFYSRCQRYTLHNDFISAAQDLEEAEEKSDDRLDPLTLDLFNRPDWRKDLLGNITYAGNEIVMTPGYLMRAIQESRQLVIYNPPNEAKFALLLQQLRDEKRFLFNGEFISISSNFVIQCDIKPHADTLTNVRLESQSATTPAPEKLIYLGLHNWHELFETMIFDNVNHTATEFPDGLLAQATEFYLTDVVSQADWQMLLATIGEKYPEKQFTFILSPHAGIRDVQMSEAVSVITPEGRVIISNDSDMTVMSLRDEIAPMIIDVTPDTAFHHLIARTIFISQQEHAAQVDFHFEEKGMLKALQAGRTVILNGDLSPALYQQLLPLLAGQI